MTVLKNLSKKLQLASTLAILSVSLVNVQTAYGYITPGGDSNRVTPAIPRYSSPRPIPRPGNPPRLEPVRPNPRPYPRPIPIPYPGPVYPGPVYPVPGYPPVYPYPGYPPPINNTQYKTTYLNRWVYNESFYVRELLNYNYVGYRLKSLRVDISGNSGASVSLVVNGQVVDSKYTNGNDVYLYPGYYNDDLNSEVSSISVYVNGSVYIYNMVFELERRY